MENPRQASKRRAQPSESDVENEPQAKTSNSFDPDAPFSKPWQNSDAVLIVEEKELHVHTNILSLASTVFDKMFNGDFVESQTKRVNLEGKSYETIESLLSSIYPMENSLEAKTAQICCECSSIDRSVTAFKPFPSRRCVKCNEFFDQDDVQRQQNLKHLQKLYPLAKEYMMDALKERILSQYSQQCYFIMNVSHALDLLETFEVLNLDDEKHTEETEVKDRVIEFLSDNLPKDIKEIKSLLNGRNISLRYQLHLKALALDEALSNLYDKTADQKYKTKAHLFVQDLYALIY